MIASTCCLSPKELFVDGWLRDKTEEPIPAKLCLETISDVIPIAVILTDFQSKKISLRYWLFDEEIDGDDIPTEGGICVEGVVGSEFSGETDKVSGYFKANFEKLKVGEIDLLEDLKAHAGKWIIFYGKEIVN